MNPVRNSSWSRGIGNSCVNFVGLNSLFRSSFFRFFLLFLWCWRSGFHRSRWTEFASSTSIEFIYYFFQLDRERAQSFCGNGVRWREVAWSQGDIVHHNRPWAFLVFPRKTADAQGQIFAAQIFRRRFWGLLVYLQDYFSWNCLPVFCVVCFCDTCIFVRGSRPSSSGFFHSLPRNDGPSRTCKNLWHPYQHHDRR